MFFFFYCNLRGFTSIAKFLQSVLQENLILLKNIIYNNIFSHTDLNDVALHNWVNIKIIFMA